MNSEYSKTTLEKKLGLKDGFHCAFYNAPETFITWLNALEIQLEVNKHDTTLNFVQVFCKTIEELEYSVNTYKSRLNKDGMLWVSWPKGSSKIETTLKREPIRDFVLTNGLVDVKIAAIDNDWSGLKFVYRLKDRI